MLVLSLLLGTIYGYWALTNDAAIRRMARAYLRDLTGAHVALGEAHFELFGGIQLGNVSAYISPTDKEPFFRAPKIILRHQPWSLLRGKLYTVEVVLMEPEIVNEHNVEKDTYAFQALFHAGTRRHLTGELPTIRVQNALYRQLEITDNIRAENPIIRCDASFVPTEDNASYKIYIQGTDQGAKEPDRLSAVLNTTTGQLEHVDVVASTESIGRILSGQFAKWHDEYRIAGYLRGKRSTQNNTPGKLELELIDVSMALPPEQGGLILSNIRGVMIFTADAEGQYNNVVFNDVTGRMPQCNEGAFTLNGSAELIDGALIFNADVEAKGLSIPRDNPATAEIGKVIDSIIEEYHPEGEMEVAVHAERKTNGELIYSGVFQPRGLKVLYKHFAAPVNNVTGDIHFSQAGVHKIDLTGLRGQGKVSIRGNAHRAERVWAYDVMVDCVNAPFDGYTHDALPPRFKSVWDALSPEGSAIARVHAKRDDQAQRQIVVELELNGRAAITYDRFPYRLENLIGRILIEGDHVSIDRDMPVTGGNGQTRCTIYGDLIDIGKPSAMVDLSIDIWRMTLDEQLLAALPERALEAIDSVDLKFSAWRATARVVHMEDRPLDFSIRASVTDVAFNVPQFSSPVTKGTGEVTIEPDRAIIKQLAANCARTPVNLSGQVFINADNVGVDINIDAPQIAVDEEFLSALPPDLQRRCQRFAPEGRVGASLWLLRNAPGVEKTTDYRLVLSPQDMQVCYEAFPYPFVGLSGTIVLTPDLVELINLTTRDGEMYASINGMIEYGSGLHGRDLSLTAKNVPIDEDLLAAVPEDLAALSKRFSQGGVCNMDISRLDFLRVPRPEGQADDPPLLWYAEGTIGVADAVISLGLGEKSMSGHVTGVVGRNEAGLAIQGEVQLDRIHIGQRELTDLQCKISKAYASSMLHLDDFVGQTHGGRVSEGFAEIDLADPLQYGIRLSVEDVDLNNLLNADVADEAKLSDMTGKLTGRLELIAVADDPDSRRASGVLLVSKASMVRMPVLLGMMHLFTLQLPGNSVFSDGVISYRLNGNTLTFEEIHLVGPTLGIVGSGTMDMESEELKLTFLAGPPGEVPSLLALDELLEHVVREIVEIQVTGTLSAPDMHTVPLRGVDDVITRLLRPGEE